MHCVITPLSHRCAESSFRWIITKSSLCCRCDENTIGVVSPSRQYCLHLCVVEINIFRKHSQAFIRYMQVSRVSKTWDFFSGYGNCPSEVCYKASANDFKEHMQVNLPTTHHTPCVMLMLVLMQPCLHLPESKLPKHWYEAHPHRTPSLGKVVLPLSCT